MTQFLEGPTPPLIRGGWGGVPTMLIYIVHLESIDQFLSKENIRNSDQDKIWFEPYCPFNDST